MKKLSVALLAIIMLFSLTVLPASAADYSRDGLTVTVPDKLIDNSAMASEYDMTKTWLSEDENFEFSLLIEANDDNYTYVNYSEKELSDIYEDYIEGDEDVYTLNKSENVTVNGFEGIMLDMDVEYLGTSLRHVVYGFSTKQNVYTLYFYIYDESYADSVNEIVNSVVIDGNNYDAEKEGNIQYIIYIAVVMVVSAVISKIKKNKAKKQGMPVGYQPINNEDGTNVVFNPETDAHNIEHAEAPQQQAAPAKTEDTGFAAKEAAKERKEREKLFNE